MTVRISHLSFDAHDAYAQSRWWAEALGWAENPEDPNLPGHEECMIFSPDGSHRLLFIAVPDAKIDGAIAVVASRRTLTCPTVDIDAAFAFATDWVADVRSGAVKPM